MGKLLDLTGKTLGNRTVIKRVPSAGQAHWLVRCKCGQENIVPSRDCAYLMVVLVENVPVINWIRRITCKA